MKDFFICLGPFAAALGVAASLWLWKRGVRNQYRTAMFLKYVDLYPDNDALRAAMKAYSIDPEKWKEDLDEIRYLVKRVDFIKLRLKIDPPKGFVLKANTHAWFVARAVRRWRKNSPEGLWDTVIKPFVGGGNELETAIMSAALSDSDLEDRGTNRRSACAVGTSPIGNITREEFNARDHLDGILLLLSNTTVADIVRMNSGNDIECVVLQENADSVVIRRGYGTMAIPPSAIASVSRSPLLGNVAPTTKPVEGQRLPPWNDVVGSLAKLRWATNVQQIPATVVDVGVMRNVPYQSYRCGADYEVNAYGDPERPAGIEIGIHRSLLNDTQAKRNCVEFIASILPDQSDAAIAKTLLLTKDAVTRSGLTSEITPATDPMLTAGGGSRSTTRTT